jgi:hypothetical protein
MATEDNCTRIATRGRLLEDDYTRMTTSGWPHEDGYTRMVVGQSRDGYTRMASKDNCTEDGNIRMTTGYKWMTDYTRMAAQESYRRMTAREQSHVDELSSRTARGWG